MVFHFNKKHLEDPTIPMWVVKSQGKTYYVNHVTCSLPWTTKETPDNSATKGSIKIKNCLLAIDNSNDASISELTPFDKVRIRNKEKGITRIMWTNTAFEKILKDENITYTPFKRVHGACATAYTVCDLLKESEAVLLALKYPKLFRILMPNEPQYRAYDDTVQWKNLQDLYDEYADDDDEDS